MEQNYAPLPPFLYETNQGNFSITYGATEDRDNNASET